MAYTIRCKTCSKISKGNYIYKPKREQIAKKLEFKECVDKNHNIQVEKVY